MEVMGATIGDYQGVLNVYKPQETVRPRECAR